MRRTAETGVPLMEFLQPPAALIPILLSLSPFTRNILIGLLMRFRDCKNRLWGVIEAGLRHGPTAYLNVLTRRGVSEHITPDLAEALLGYTPHDWLLWQDHVVRLGNLAPNYTFERPIVQLLLGWPAERMDTYLQCVTDVLQIAGPVAGAGDIPFHLLRLPHRPQDPQWMTFPGLFADIKNLSPKLDLRSLIESLVQISPTDYGDFIACYKLLEPSPALPLNQQEQLWRGLCALCNRGNARPPAELNVTMSTSEPRPHSAAQVLELLQKVFKPRIIQQVNGAIAQILCRLGALDAAGLASVAALAPEVVRQGTDPAQLLLALILSHERVAHVDCVGTD